MLIAIDLSLFIVQISMALHRWTKQNKIEHLMLLKGIS